MPFVSSVRGTFGPTSENRGVGNPGAIAEIVRQNPNSSALPTGGTITTAGGYRVHTFTTIGQSTFGTTGYGQSLPVEMFVYGAGGCAGSTRWGQPNGWSYGGGGGFSGGNATLSSGNYTVQVGETGYFASGTGTTASGGGAGGTTWGNGGGGGLSGVFNGAYSFANAILIAGGGGGGGTSRASGQTVNRGGGGGGSTGQDGTSYTGNRQGRGGTQSGVQFPSAGDWSPMYNQGPLHGGTPTPHGAGGGGGYYGGTGGAYFEPNDMGGGGGGSSYSSGAITSPVLTQASYQTPANTGGAYYSSGIAVASTSGPEQRGGNGIVVIRYLI